MMYDKEALLKRYPMGTELSADYTIGELLGTGGTGAVFELISKGNSKSLVVKIVPEERQLRIRAKHSPNLYSSEFRRAYEVKNRLSNSKYVNIPKQIGRKAWENKKGEDTLLIMQRMVPLDQYLHEKAIRIRDVIKMGIDICNALTDCEKHNIVHSDIKPSNILRNVKGDYVLGDFGTAYFLDQHNKSFEGTLMYSAPELLTADGQRTYQSDIYSLGLVMFEILNGNRLDFKTDGKDFASNKELLRLRIANAGFSRPKHCPSELYDSVMKACAYKPEDRYQNAEQFKLALYAVLKASFSNAVIPIHPIPGKKISNSILQTMRFTGKNWKSQFDTTIRTFSHSSHLANKSNMLGALTSFIPPYPHSFCFARGDLKDRLSVFLKTFVYWTLFTCVLSLYQPFVRVFVYLLCNPKTSMPSTYIMSELLTFCAVTSIINLRNQFSLKLNETSRIQKCFRNFSVITHTVAAGAYIVMAVLDITEWADFSGLISLMPVVIMFAAATYIVGLSIQVREVLQS